MPKKPIDYTNGKIYKIINDTSDMIYIGSTCDDLHKRFYTHKKIYKCYNNGNYKKIPCNSKYIFDDNIETSKIILLENVCCSNKSELLMKEREWIDKLINMKKNIVNRYKPIISKEEKKEYSLEYNKKYRVNNKDKIKKYIQENSDHIAQLQKEYRVKNSENIKLYKKEYYQKKKDELKEKSNNYYQENKEQVLERTKQYYQNNKDKIAQYNKEWREKNKEKTKEYREKHKEKYQAYQKDYNKEYREKNKARLSQKITCDCGSIYAYRNKAQHFKSKKHQKYLESLGK